MAPRVSSRSYRREDVDEFDRRLRRFNESLAQKERRMLRQIIVSALEEDEMEVSGFLNADDDTVFLALRNYLLGQAEGE
jgi:hypothetical protein